MADQGPPLQRYRQKRDFRRSPEPAGGSASDGALRFVIQRHAATRLHHDFRLEWGGVLKSWAVTRGPSLDPADKRLAVEVEDHPIDYAEFEGVIPKPGYGAGTVMLWDRGLWAPLDATSVEADLARGELKFVVSGERIRGGFVLVRLKPRKGDAPGRHNWLLIKERDSMARPGAGEAPLAAATSVTTGRTMAEIAAGASAKDATPGEEPAEGIPGFVDPQLCRLVVAPPAGPGWVHELKIDGYRLQLRVESRKATLRTRTGLDWSGRFPDLARAAAELPDGLIDGEVVALDADGQPSFPQLQARLAGEGKAPMVFYAFDLLHDGTRDLRPLPLHERKTKLRERLDAVDVSPAFRFLADFTAPGGAVLESACRLDMEGVISKRRDAPYMSGRNDHWTKAKCRGRDEFVVGGCSASSTGTGLGALLVGAHRDGKLVYVGRVGTGFGQAAALLLRTMKAAIIKTSPFVGKQPDRLAGVTWVRPELVVEVAYGGWTEAGILRHASFQGIREDKPAQDVTEPPAPATVPVPPASPRRGAGPALTHPDRILWPATADSPAVTKADLADHYARFADRILEHVAGRPLSVLRVPEGIEGESFFQRHAMPGQSPLIGAVEIAGQARPFMRIDDGAALAALAQASVVELHPWGATAQRPEVPDRLVFDLDPAPDVDFAQVVAGAHDLQARLESLGLTPFPRVTGGKGVHLVVPLATRGRDATDWETAKTFARLLCTLMAQDAPKLYTTTMAKKARVGRIFLDHLRNDRLATAIANFSPRARPLAPVAVPIAWTELVPKLDPAGYRLPALANLPETHDPWHDFGVKAGSLREATERITVRR